MSFRNILVWSLSLPITLFLFPFAVLAYLIDRSGNGVHSIATFWLRICLILSGVSVEVRGLENVPKGTGPVIFASNHKGAFDIPTLQVNIPIQFRWIAKSGLFTIPLTGWAMRMAGYISIDTHSGKAFLTSIRAAVKKIQDGNSVLIFPEGERNSEPGLLPFKRGVFLLAVKSKAPIIPIAIKGTEKILPRGQSCIRPGRVVISFCPPIASEGKKELELGEMTRAAIELELGKL
jgi:1-acyl-sn-glycerol-3-phosphate acyltransferase